MPKEPHLLCLCHLEGAKWPHNGDNVKNRVTRSEVSLRAGPQGASHLWTDVLNTDGFPEV